MLTKSNYTERILRAQWHFWDQQCIGDPSGRESNGWRWSHLARTVKLCLCYLLFPKPGTLPLTTRKCQSNGFEWASCFAVWAWQKALYLCWCKGPASRQLSPGAVGAILEPALARVVLMHRFHPDNTPAPCLEDFHQGLTAGHQLGWLGPNCVSYTGGC